jgi:hypothetical protein
MVVRTVVHCASDEPSYCGLGLHHIPLEGVRQERNTRSLDPRKQLILHRKSRQRADCHLEMHRRSRPSTRVDGDVVAGEGLYLVLECVVGENA